MKVGRKYNNYYQEKCSRTFHGIICIAVFLVLVVFAFLVSCKSLPHAAPTNTHTDDTDSIRTELRIDTVYKDRWHREYVKGDTMYIHDSIDRWHKEYIYIHDSIDHSRIDTIYNTVQVEKKGSAFWKGSGIAFWVLLGILFIGLAIGIVIKVAK